MKCQCGFTTDPEGNCNGTHKVVRAVRDKIVIDIEAIEIKSSVSNAVGMKAQAIQAAKG